MEQLELFASAPTPDCSQTTETVKSTIQTILAEAEINGHTLKLTCGDLDRDTYQKVDEVLKRLWGKWKGRQRIHQFTYDPTDAIAEYVATGKLPPKNATAYFPTPAEVVNDMLLTVSGCPLAILEPSAGQGALVGACIEKWDDATVDCFEFLDMNAAILERRGHNVTRGDFLDADPRAEYDLAIMNPPFSVAGDKVAYMTHIYHAFKFLKPGGELVAIIPEGWESKTGRKFDEFREFVAMHSQEAFRIDRGAFKDSGTMIGTYCISLSKQTSKMEEHCSYGSRFEWTFSMVHDGSYGYELSRQKNAAMTKPEYVKFAIDSLYENDSLLSDMIPASLSERYEALTS